MYEVVSPLYEMVNEYEFGTPSVFTNDISPYVLLVMIVYRNNNNQTQQKHLSINGIH